MSNDTMYWKLFERKNVHVKRGKEWALDIDFTSESFSNYWNVATFDLKPNEKKVKEILEIIKRSCLIYHCSIVVKMIPGFNIKNIKKDRG